MLKPLQSARVSSNAKAGGRYAIIASRYNARYVDGMLRAAQKVLREAGAAHVDTVRVPGAFEIPVVAASLAAGVGGAYSAVICLGVILRGETTHAQFIGESVTNVLAQVQIQHRLPIIHEVLLLENEEQAKVRCLDPKHNRGAEAAQTAIEMARIMGRLTVRGAKGSGDPPAPGRIARGRSPSA
jgi:6,7-dimethyl-8-ribityllumazine synthase